MKFVPKLCAIAALLLLAGCALPSPGVPGGNDVKIVVGTNGPPNPAQTTWAVPDSTPTVTPTATSTKEVLAAPSEPASSCEGIPEQIVTLYAQGLMKCPQLLDLKNELAADVGESAVLTALLAYHANNCTELGGKGGYSDGRYVTPKSPPTANDLRYIVPSDDASATDSSTMEYRLGKTVPCRTPEGEATK